MGKGPIGWQEILDTGKAASKLWNRRKESKVRVPVAEEKLLEGTKMCTGDFY